MCDYAGFCVFHLSRCINKQIVKVFVFICLGPLFSLLTCFLSASSHSSIFSSLCFKRHRVFPLLTLCWGFLFKNHFLLSWWVYVDITLLVLHFTFRFSYFLQLFSFLNFLAQAKHLNLIISSFLLKLDLWNKSGQVDTQLQISGSILQPNISGKMKLSHGEAYLPHDKGSGTAPFNRETSDQSRLPAGGYNRIVASKYVSRFLSLKPAASSIQFNQSSGNFSMNFSLYSWVSSSICSSNLVEFRLFAWTRCSIYVVGTSLLFDCQLDDLSN